MELLIQRILLKIASILTIFIALPSVAVADSMYDGIWQTKDNSYFSITITGNTVLVVSLGEVATYQDPLRGAYIGSLPSTIGSLMSSPENPLSIRVVLDESIPRTTLYGGTQLPISIFYSWQVNFMSKDSATIHRPWKDYPSTESLPLSLRKIF